MDEHYHQLINDRYRSSRSDSTELFQTVLSVADSIGADRAWACLEQCVIEKRLAWLDQHLAGMERTGKPLADAYHIFYEVYLGISAPQDGEVAEATDKELVTRWWNRCPTLEACRTLGLDTRDICRRAYHRPVQVFLARIDPRLRFDRDYRTLRPYGLSCEETITLEAVA